jgi:hypothetical protein
MGDLVRRLGSEKLKDFTNDFDLIVDKYRIIADASGYHGVLKFNKEHGKIIVFVELEEE